MLATSVLHAAHLVPNNLVTETGHGEANGIVFALAEGVIRDQGWTRYQIWYEELCVGRALFHPKVMSSAASHD